jgi:catechol 2,3-dioxygenase-like lactoylglutathione lyase family enzyme
MTSDDELHFNVTLARCPVGPVIPVSDLDASIAFYQGVLGLSGEPAPSGYRLHAGSGSVAYLLGGTDYAGQAGWPLASFATDNLDGIVDDLAQRGVPTMKDVPYPVDARGIADLDGMRIAWITDPDQQVISIFERTD